MSKAPIDDLLEVMAALRDPERGCPWDVEQTFATIAPYTIEEAYEVAEAIAEGDMTALREELGDLLLQVVYHAQMAREAGHFDFNDVAAGIATKMVRRHPHVFGDAEVADAGAQTVAWEAMKAAERASRGKKAASALDGVAVALPALTRAVKLQKRAARVGFDWSDVPPIMDKLHEELRELEDELSADPRDPARIEEEFGDLLFVAANLARRLDIDPEQALRAANAKFERRFRGIEQRLRAQGLRAEDQTLDELDAHWDAVKAAERQAKAVRPEPVEETPANGGNRKPLR